MSRRIDREAGTWEASEPLVEFLVLLARVLLRAGTAAQTVVMDFEHVAASYGARVDVAVTPTTVLISLPGRRARLATATPGRLPQYLQAELVQLVHELAVDPLPLEDAQRRLESLETRAQPPRSVTVVLGYAMFVGGLALVAQASPQEFLAALAASLPVAVLILWSSALRRGRLLVPFLAAVALAALVLQGVQLGVIHGSAFVVVVPALTFFVPSHLLTVALTELAARQLDAGVARLGYALVRLALLVFGAQLGFALVGGDVAPTALVAARLPLWWSPLGVLLFGLGMALVFQLRPRDLPWSLGLLLGTWAVQQLVGVIVGPPFGAFAGALFLTHLSTLLGRRFDVPATVLCLPAFYLLLAAAIGFLGGTATWADLLPTFVAVSLGTLLGATLVAPSHGERPVFGPS